MDSTKPNALQALAFEDHPIRIFLDANGDPRWVAKDVAEALGYTWSGMSRVAHVPEQWRGVASVVTPSGTQEMITLSEQGLYFFLNRSDKQAAVPFQMWIAGEVLPSIRKSGKYAVKPMSQAEMLLAQAQAMVEQERRTAELETRVAAIEARTVAASDELLALPAPAAEADPLTDRARINRLVRTHAEATSLDFQAVWNQLYREFRDRCHVDLKARAKALPKGKGPLDIAEAEGLTGKLYAVAWALYSKRG
jgi:prophage antirepressor-like protein